MDKSEENNLDATIYYIRVFDDGNNKYKDVPNEWIITSFTRGKIGLKNLNGVDVIDSISAWKISPVKDKI
jgi:hypothetical protein